MGTITAEQIIETLRRELATGRIVVRSARVNWSDDMRALMTLIETTQLANDTAPQPSSISMLKTKEHADLIAMFEREYSGRLDKEKKEFWEKGHIYQDGQVNALFLAYRRGCAYGKASYRND